MNIEFFSHEQQDEFAYNLFGGKTGGTFIDLACANPIIGNNTYPRQLIWQKYFNLLLTI
jgi:hypothetical protein